MTSTSKNRTRAGLAGRLEYAGNRLVPPRHYGGAAVHTVLACVPVAPKADSAPHFALLFLPLDTFKILRMDGRTVFMADLGSPSTAARGMIEAGDRLSERRPSLHAEGRRELLRLLLVRFGKMESRNIRSRLSASLSQKKKQETEITPP